MSTVFGSPLPPTSEKAGVQEHLDPVVTCIDDEHALAGIVHGEVTRPTQKAGSTVVLRQGIATQNRASLRTLESGVGH